jgi:hypothetical protein
MGASRAAKPSIKLKKNLKEKEGNIINISTIGTYFST